MEVQLSLRLTHNLVLLHKLLGDCLCSDVSMYMEARSVGRRIKTYSLVVTKQEKKAEQVGRVSASFENLS